MKLRSILAASAVCAASAAFAAGEVTSDTTFGILKLDDSTSTNLLISVPWADCESGNVFVSNVVSTVGLTDGDYLILKDDNNYYSWKLDNGAWTAFAVVDSELGVNPIMDASGQRIARGKSLMLHRSNPSASSPIYLFGRYDSSSATSSISGSSTTLVANPGTDGSPLLLTNLAGKFTSGSVADGDSVIIDNKTYTYVEDPEDPDKAYWTYKAKKVTSQSTGIEFAQKVIVTTEKDVSIAAGKGFWYQRKSASAATITW